MVLVLSFIYIIAPAFYNVYKLGIFRDSITKWIIILVLLLTRLIYGIWSLIIQNTIGEDGPVEIGNILAIVDRMPKLPT